MKYQEAKVSGKWSEMVREEQPSEKALERGISTLSDLELVGLILGSCGQSYSVEEASSKVLEAMDAKSLTPEAQIGRASCRERV